MKTNKKTKSNLEHLHIKVQPWMKERLVRIAKNNNRSLTEVVKTIVESAFIASDADFVSKGGKI